MKNETVLYFDRQKKMKCEEQVYGAAALNLLYGDSLFARIVSFFILKIVRLPFISFLYGTIQKHPFSKRKILPFISKYGIDAQEFKKDIGEFSSFNDFFCRELKADARPIHKDPDKVIIPADARYLAYQNIENEDGFLVKGKKFSLEALIGDAVLAEQFKDASMVLARLCPVDYHRFHFPFDAKFISRRLINGYLYSVNPIAVKKNVQIFTENKRYLSELYHPDLGKVLYIEVGATNVGSVYSSADIGKKYKKGDEKGYFSFGASQIIMLFTKDSIQLDEDLLKNSSQYLETRCLLGQTLGHISS